MTEASQILSKIISGSATQQDRARLEMIYALKAKSLKMQPKRRTRRSLGSFA